MPGLNILLRPHQLIGVAWYVVALNRHLEITRADVGWLNKRPSQSMVEFWQMT